jgi:hypothetical protein
MSVPEPEVGTSRQWRSLREGLAGRRRPVGEGLVKTNKDKGPCRSGLIRANRYCEHRKFVWSRPPKSPLMTQAMVVVIVLRFSFNRTGSLHGGRVSITSHQTGREREDSNQQ